MNTIKKRKRRLARLEKRTEPKQKKYNPWWLKLRIKDADTNMET